MNSRARFPTRLAMCPLIVPAWLIVAACSNPAAEARAAIEINDLARATTILEQAIASAPRDIELRNLLLAVQERRGEWSQAVETGRVVSTLDPSTKSQLRLMHAHARAGQISVARQMTADWPRDRIELELLEELHERRLLAISPAMAAESDEDYPFTVLKENPSGFKDAAAAVGVPFYWATQVVILADEQTPEGYTHAGRVSTAFSQLRKVDPPLARDVRDEVERVLSMLREPEIPSRSGSPALDDLRRQSYFRQAEWYYFALGELQAALARSNADYSRALLSYRFAIDVWESNPASRQRDFPSIGLLRRIDLLHELGENEELAEECQRFSVRFPTWYLSRRPDGCHLIDA